MVESSVIIQVNQLKQSAVIVLGMVGQVEIERTVVLETHAEQ